VLYEFTFVVEGVNADDDDAISVLAEHLDATLARGAGVSLLLITAEGVNAVDAARSAIAGAESLVPQIRFLYLDRDLVGISEIAKRTGHSRQNVTQWVTGERRAANSGPFPRVEGVVGRARIWLWAEVNSWLNALGLGDEAAAPERNEITNIDFFILHKDAISLNRPKAEMVWPQVFVNFTPSAMVHLEHAGSLKFDTVSATQDDSQWVVMASGVQSSIGTGGYEIVESGISKTPQSGSL
jgi:hypothetical protein